MFGATSLPPTPGRSASKRDRDQSTATLPRPVSSGSTIRQVVPSPGNTPPKEFSAVPVMQQRKRSASFSRVMEREMDAVMHRPRAPTPAKALQGSNHIIFVAGETQDSPSLSRTNSPLRRARPQSYAHPERHRQQRQHHNPNRPAAMTNNKRLSQTFDYPPHNPLDGSPGPIVESENGHVVAKSNEAQAQASHNAEEANGNGRIRVRPGRGNRRPSTPSPVYEAQSRDRYKPLSISIDVDATNKRASSHGQSRIPVRSRPSGGAKSEGRESNMSGTRSVTPATANGTGKSKGKQDAPQEQEPTLRPSTSGTVIRNSEALSPSPGFLRRAMAYARSGAVESEVDDDVDNPQTGPSQRPASQQLLQHPLAAVPYQSQSQSQSQVRIQGATQPEQSHLYPPLQMDMTPTMCDRPSSPHSMKTFLTRNPNPSHHTHPLGKLHSARAIRNSMRNNKNNASASNRIGRYDHLFPANSPTKAPHYPPGQEPWNTDSPVKMGGGMSQEEFENRVVDRRDAGFVNRDILRYDADDGDGVGGEAREGDAGASAGARKKKQDKGKGKKKEKKKEETENEREREGCNGETKMKDGKAGCGCVVM